MWKVLLGGVILAALGLRLWGMGFGLPYEYHVDEVQYVRQAAQMGSSGLEPAWWNNPPFHKYLLLAEDGGLYVIGRLLGWYTSTADFGEQLSLDPTWLYLLGRGTSAVMGTLTVLIAFFIGRSAYNLRVGLTGAFFLAGVFLAAREAHYAVNDTAVTLWMTLCLLAGVQIASTGKFRWYILGAAALGLGFATKYSALAAALPLILAHFLSPGVTRRNWGLAKLLGALGIAAAAAILASPYFVLSFDKAWQDAYQALYLAGKYGFEGWQIDPAGGYAFYLKTLLWGLGWGLTLLAVIGLATAFLRRKPADLILAVLPVVLFLALGRQKMYFARFILPIVPPLLILGAAWLDQVVAKFAPKPDAAAGLRKQDAWVAGIAVLLVLQPLTSTVRSDYLLTRTDTRSQAKAWAEANIPEGARIALDWEFHSLPLSTTAKPYAQSEREYQADIIGGKGLSDHPLDWYRQQGYEYLVASSHIYRIPLVDGALNRQRDAFYASLDQELEKIAEFRPTDQPDEPPFIFDEVYGPAISLWSRERPGPTIKIYRLQPDGG